VALFCRNKREQLKQLILECVLSRLSTFEALQYIKHKLGVSVSRRYYFESKQRIKEDSNNKLKYFTENRDAYLFEFFERVQEIEYLQKKLWELHDNAEKNKDPKLQLECLHELRQMTMTLTDLYAVLPSIEGFEFQYEKNNNNVLLRKDNRINWTDEERKAFGEDDGDGDDPKAVF
jgi:hypothetical protein